jgi:hypothetical protein
MFQWSIEVYPNYGALQLGRLYPSVTATKIPNGTLQDFQEQFTNFTFTQL